MTETGTQSPESPAQQVDPTTSPVAPTAVSNPNLGPLLASEPLRLRGIGPVDFGMTVAEAEVALGAALVPDSALVSDACSLATVEGDVGGPLLMVIWNGDFAAGRIMRADLSDQGTTLSGVTVGDTKDDVLAVYGDRIEVTPHKYEFAEGGEYLTFVPVDAADASYRVVMETFDGRVTKIRAGLLPEVEFVETCL